MQYFGHEREHGWLTEKQVMLYEGLEHFQVNCPDLKQVKKAKLAVGSYLDIVKSSRKLAWTIATQDSEDAYRMEKEERKSKLTFAYADCKPDVADTIDLLSPISNSFLNYQSHTVSNKKKRRASTNMNLSHETGSPPCKMSRLNSEGEYNELLASPKHQQCLIMFQKMYDDMVLDPFDKSKLRETLLERWKLLNDQSTTQISQPDIEHICNIVLSPKSPIKGILFLLCEFV